MIILSVYAYHKNEFTANDFYLQGKNKNHMLWVFLKEYGWTKPITMLYPKGKLGAFYQRGFSNA